MIQLLILTVLFFVLMFGIGFILNMLLKTTWFTIYLYVIVMLPFVIYWQWNSSLSFGANLLEYSYVDLATAIAGLIGAYVSGVTIKTLRANGYKMF